MIIIINFEELCENSIDNFTQQAQKTCRVLQEIEENPEMILTDIFHGQGCYNEITNVIKTFGKDFTLCDFQAYIYKLLIPFLKKELGAHYNFDFYKHTYSSELRISYDKYTLANISILNEMVQIWEPLHIESLKQQLAIYENRKNKSQALLIKLKKAGMNPFKICKNPIDFFYFIFHYKMYKTKMDYMKKELKKEIKFCLNKIIDIELKIDEQELFKDYIEKYTQKIIDYFTKYNYKIYKN